jgi:hypothetical protein
MSVIKQAEEEVAAAAPKVLGALGRIKFLILTVPLVCVVAGLLTQAFTQERNIGVIMFKLGTFATPDKPEPAPLAGEQQLRARLRQHSKDIREEYPDSLLISTIVENDVVTVTGTAKGDLRTTRYLSELVQREIDFQNGRLEKMQAVQAQRMTAQRDNLEKFKQQRDALEMRISETDDPIAMLAMQQGIDNASTRIAGIQKELDVHAVLNASDLFVDTTAVIREQEIIASSDWYRPLIAGSIGLGVGLVLTLLIAIVAVLLSFSSSKPTKDSEQ